MRYIRLALSVLNERRLNLQCGKENDAKHLKKRRQFDGSWQIWTEPLFSNGGVSLGQV